MPQLAFLCVCEKPYCTPASTSLAPEESNKWEVNREISTSQIDICTLITMSEILTVDEVTGL